MKASTMKIPIVLLTLASLLPVHASGGGAACVLWEVLSEEEMEIIHAKALPDGAVEIIFGASVNDADQLRVVERLRADPRVREVRASGSPRTWCRFY